MCTKAYLTNQREEKRRESCFRTTEAGNDPGEGQRIAAQPHYIDHNKNLTMLLKASLSDGTWSHKKSQLKGNNHAIFGSVGYLMECKICIDFIREWQHHGPVGLLSASLSLRGRRLIASIKKIALGGNGFSDYC